MKYLLIENEEGQYIKIECTERYDILECEYAVGPRADDFQEYDNIEQAMEAYGVEEYHEPVPKVVEPVIEEEQEEPEEVQPEIQETIDTTVTDDGEILQEVIQEEVEPEEQTCGEAEK